MYLLQNGDEVMKEQIEEAFNCGDAVIIHTHGINKTNTGLMLDGEHIDTRGECYSVWDEVWSREPKSVSECIRLALC